MLAVARTIQKPTCCRCLRVPTSHWCTATSGREPASWPVEQAGPPGWLACVVRVHLVESSLPPLNAFCNGSLATQRNVPHTARVVHVVVRPNLLQKRHHFKGRQAAPFFERPLRPARLRYLLRCVVRQCGVMQGAATKFAADSQILGCGTIQKTLQTGFNTEYGVCRQSALNLTDTRAEFSPESDTISGSEKRHRLQSKVVLSS